MKINAKQTSCLRHQELFDFVLQAHLPFTVTDVGVNHCATSLSQPPTLV